METSLHRELKLLYADSADRTELRVGRYRVDAAADDQLVEIQHGGLAAIRDKIRWLLSDHRVLVVKPLVCRKYLVKRRKRGGRITSRRLSPKRGRALDLFDELVHFTRLFPHPNLTLEMLCVDIEEWRFPGHGRRRYRRAGDYQVEDQKLLHIREKHSLKTAADLVNFIPVSLPQPFTTADLAQALGIKRWEAQKAAYCLRHTGSTIQVGKQGNAYLYAFAPQFRAAG